MAQINKIISFPSREKHSPPAEQEQGFLKEEHGLEGDSRAKGGERQITVLAVETKDWMENSTKKGLCFQKFKGNVEIEGIDFTGIKKGDILSMGEAEIKITQMGKPCYPEDCALAAEGDFCLLHQTAAFAKVVKSGTIKREDRVTIKGENIHGATGRTADY